MKKALYIVAFAFLGLVLATIVHAVVEMAALKIIFENPEQFASTFWWQEWFTIHTVVSILLWLIGLVFGARYGIKYWEPYGSKPGFYHWTQNSRRL